MTRDSIFHSLFSTHSQEQAIKEKQVSGRVQIQVWYRDDTNELVVNLLAADDLALRDESRF